VPNAKKRQKYMTNYYKDTACNRFLQTGKQKWRWNIFPHRQLFIFTLFQVLSVFSIHGQQNEIILYFSNKSGVFQLYKHEQGNDTLLINQLGYDYWWVYTSPDKTKFLTYRSDTSLSNDQNNYDAAELFLHNIDGSNPVLLIDTNTYSWEAHGVAKFSPDGSKIIMAAMPNTSSPWYGFVTDSMGQNPQQISSWFMVDPAWSPDGSKIVFCAFPNNNLTFDLTQLEIHVADYNHTIDTITNIVQITTSTGRVHDPCFSHAGDRIAFSDGNAFYTDADIMVVDTNGANLTTLFSDIGANGGSICWSQDDSTIWFHNVTLFVNPFQIRKANSINGAMTTVFQNPGYSYINPHQYIKTVTAIPEIFSANSLFTIFPNPFSIQTTLQTDIFLHNATLTVENCLGQTVVQMKNISGQTVTFHRNNLQSGLYFIRLTQDNQLITTNKILITD
jgi:Tol biopolymer transport system component